MTKQNENMFSEVCSQVTFLHYLKADFRKVECSHPEGIEVKTVLLITMYFISPNVLLIKASGPRGAPACSQPRL